MNGDEEVHTSSPNRHEADNSLKRVAILSGAVPTVIAVLAIVFCMYLLRDNDQLRRNRECVRRIDLYAADLRDDINIQGWDALVTRAEGSANQNVQEIARRMRTDITNLKGARDIRRNATMICDEDPDFEPPPR